MLGCQDFCGYYDWTFQYVGQRFGPEAVRSLWAVAIGDEAQAHYAQAGLEQGLRGLYNTWTKTGQDEHCDWTFTLDEERNALRWDMRECPSKGFLLKNDLNACEDYCDHCMGWMVPLLDKIGVEVAAHEHNHCGQCWGEMRLRGKPFQPIEVPFDIRSDERWNEGYVDRWQDGIKLPVLDAPVASPDPCDVVIEWFSKASRVVIYDPPVASAKQPVSLPAGALIMSDEIYVAGRGNLSPGSAVLIGNSSAHLAALASRWEMTPSAERPLLLHAYWPSLEPLPFRKFNLPRPVPALPLLIRHNQYRHHPGKLVPASRELMVMIAGALGKPFEVLD